MSSSNGNGSAASASTPKVPKLDLPSVSKRLNIIYDTWDSDSDSYKNADALLLALGLPDEDRPYQKVTAMQSWLFGYELRDTIIVFLKKDIFVISGVKKIQLLEDLSNIEIKKHKVKCHFLPISKTDNKESFSKVFEEIKKAGNNLGVIIKEKYFGDFAKSWESALNDSGINKVDITPGFSSCLLVKDAQEIKYMQTSAKISDKMLVGQLLPKIEKTIDNEEKVSHNDLAEFTLGVFGKPEKLKGKLGNNVDLNNIDYAYTPIIQSGGNYDLKPSANSDDENLKFDTIIVSLGARYKDYCSNIARTYFIDPVDEQKKNYNFLLELQTLLLKSFKAGNKVGQVYDKALEHINNFKPELVPHFLKNCGYGIGIEFQESLLVINSNNHRVMRAGMVFNFVLGFQNLVLKAGTEKEKKYSMMITDTILVVDDGAAEILTSESPKEATEVFYEIAEDDDDHSVTLEMPEDVKDVTGKVRETKEKAKSIEEKRRQHQNMLAQRNKQEQEHKIRQLEGLAKKNSQEIDYTSITNKLPDIYSGINSYPAETVKNRIMIDTKKEAIILPIFGHMVPFHISTIKNSSKMDEFLRINFNTPTSFTQEQIDAGLIPPQLMYIREVTYKISDLKAMANTHRSILDLRKRVSTRETEDREKRTLIAQEKLILRGAGRAPRLTEVYARPTFGGARRTLGVLEAHENGLRFSPSNTKDKTPIDILYKNIKHPIFQAAGQESMAVVHFHLFDAIMIGKKQTKDVQFYTEISEMSQSLDVSSRSFNDEEEEERRERALREKINTDFKNFTKKVEEIAGIEFERPYPELGFYGVHNIANVYIQPSVHCLLSILESPFFVLSLDEVEIACFERVIRSLRNFDLVFVFKDYSRKTIRIDAIPREYYETIKEWLDSVNIKFYSLEKNFNWKNIMDHIRSDLKKFNADGGWSFLDPQEDEEEEDEDDDDDYNPSDSETDSDYISSMSEASSEEEEEESDGEDWDQLDSKAEREDKQKNYDDQNKRKRDDISKPKSSSSSSSSSSSKPSSSKPSSSKPSSSSSSKSSSSKSSSSSSKSSTSSSSKSSSSKKK